LRPAINHYVSSAIKSLISVLTLTLLLLSSARAQQPSSLSTSDALRTMGYPAILCAHCVIPEWDGNYFVHHELDEDWSLFTAWNANGEKFLSARVAIPGHIPISSVSASVTKDRGLLAVAGARGADGQRERFIAKTDPAGYTTSWFATPGFLASRACEAPDGTVWLLGYEQRSDTSAGADVRHVIRHYSLGGAVLGSFAPLNFNSPHSELELEDHTRTRLYCGNDRLSAFLARPGRYIEVDFATGKETTWQIDPSPVERDRFHGFAVTSDHRAFVAYSISGTQRLYELRTPADTHIAQLLPVESAVSKDRGTGEITYLYGAEGNQLLVWVSGKGPAVSWVTVPTPLAPAPAD
jgi:hypothetical protein